MPSLVLAVNPGATSTKLALYEDDQLISSETLLHDPGYLAPHHHVIDQLPLRLSAVRSWLQTQLDRRAARVGFNRLAGIAARGGLLHPIPSGTYTVDEAMLKDLRDS